MARCAVLVVAAGRGRRFGGDLPKQYHDLDGRPVLAHSLARFAAHPGIAQVQAVIHPDDHGLYTEAAGNLPVGAWIAGGETRQESVRLGLEALAAEDAPDLVLIHDGARPMVDGGLITRVLRALEAHPGAVPALPVADTLKRGESGLVTQTVPRSGLWRAQTPQGFWFREILSAHRKAAGLDLTDDAAVAEQAGLAVALVSGSEDNGKITTADDLERARALFRRSGGEVRMATGYDVHGFKGDGQGVMLCGVHVPHDRGMEGHSDADVALHAITDALLGCIGAGDIGLHFPPSDNRWKGADSALFLRHAAALARGLGGVIQHVDVTIICERPKVGPHRLAMIERLAEILAVGADRVSVKATTTEGLGFTGRREGIAAQAAVTLRLPR